MTTRFYDAEDHDGVLAILDGPSDYVPHRLASLTSDPLSFSVILTAPPSESSPSSETIAAFANFRSIPSSLSCPPLIFLEAVRVDPKLRNRGYGSSLVRDGTALTLAKLRDLGLRKPRVLSVTIPGNAVMVRCFARLGFVQTGHVLIWPGPAAFRKGNEFPDKPMLDSLGVEKLVTESSVKLLDAWEPVSVVEADLSAMFYGYFEIVTPQSLNDATAWVLPELRAKIVVHRCENITIPNHRFVVSVIAESAIAVEAAVVFVERRLCLRRFRAVISCSVAESPLLCSVAGFSFVVFELESKE